METPKRQNAETPRRRDVETSKQLRWAENTFSAPSRKPNPPADLPADPRRFWSATIDLDDLADPSDVDTTPALRRLGPLPFPRGGFPLMGFLATVYEQIASHASGNIEAPKRRNVETQRGRV